MLDIIKDVLCASGYNDTDEITFSYEGKEYLLSILRHSDLKSQGYIVLEFKEEMLLKINAKDDIFPEIFAEFKQSDLYDSEMDKNISLVFCVKRTFFSEKLRRKMVEIEDDPYYFKKYVFSYSEKEELDFRNLVKEKNCSSVEVIESHIFNKENFSEFKGNIENNNMYRLITDLVIKIPVIPIKFDICIFRP